MHGRRSSRGRAHGNNGHTDTLTTAAARRFPATTSSVGQARRFLLAQLPGASDGEADALVLMLSELATNAVQHAATDFEVGVQVAADGHRVRVEVTDGATGFPSAAGPGRGRTARTGPAHCAHAGRRLGHRDAARPARQDRVVLVAVGCAGRWRCGDGSRAARRRRGCAQGRDDRDGEGRTGAAGSGTAAVAAAAAPTESQSAWPVQGVRVVLDGLRDAVVATDDQGVIRYVNAAAEDLLGWPRGAAGRSAGLRPRARFTGRDGGRGLRRLRAHPGR